MTSIPSVVRKVDLCAVNSTIPRSMHKRLFRERYPLHGSSRRIIQHLIFALNDHLERHYPYDPHADIATREAELTAVLAGITFGFPVRHRREHDDGPRIAPALSSIA